jgi:uncharacterized membrane protein YvlD (DUF360 family)
MTALPRRRTIFRVLVVWVVTAASLQLFAALIPGVHVTNWQAALVGAAVIGLVNALIWPLFIRIALPLTVVTFGIGSLIFNGIVVLFAARLVNGLDVKSIWSGIALTIGITVINTLVTTMLAIDDDDFYYRSVTRRVANRQGAVRTDLPGVVFIQIDGLGFDVLRHAIRSGDVTTLARWIRDGSHHLLPWETDWSSQTGASQAGLLHGSNDDMPAFRWFEKERSVTMVSNHPKDAMEIERRRSNGRGLLAVDGASRSNVFSGDAPRTSLTMSTVLNQKRDERVGQAYYGYFANPYNVTRTLILAIKEIMVELWAATQQRRRDIIPRVHRGFPYPLVRAWTCVVQRDLQFETVLADIYQGRPVIYTDILGYDEVAHHSGIERHDTLGVLRDLDRQLARLEVAARGAPRPYDFVVISDHGQTQGQPFRQRWGRTLNEVVSEATRLDRIHWSTEGDESWGYLGGSLTEASEKRGWVGGALRRATRSKTEDGVVELGPLASRKRRNANGAKEPPEIVVMGSGNLGLIYFTHRPGRVLLEDIEANYPHLIPTLRAHPGIGFLLVRSRARGAVVLSRDGANYLDEEVIDGHDPLEGFGPRAAQHIKRSDGFAHVADIMVNSAYDPQTEEVFAFEELVGSHGGMGGPQSLPFLLIPSGWTLPDGDVVGAEVVHKWFRRWLADLGHPDFRVPERAERTGSR